MSETSAKCSRCANCMPDRFCRWLGAFLKKGVSDDPQCEGFAPHNACPKRPQKEMAETSIPSKQDSKDPLITCPKTQHLDKRLIQTVLSLKRLKGSVVPEMVRCGKSCHCQCGALHGPYLYLHYFSQGKVKRKYLSKAVSELLSLSEEKLAAILGQEERSSETSGAVTGCIR